MTKAKSLGLKSGLFGKDNAGYFQKGNKPHNTLHYDFAVTFSRHHAEQGQIGWKIRVAPKTWLMLNTFAWRELHGDIPPRHIVAMAPGFSELCGQFFPKKAPKQEPPGHWENICAFVQAARPYLSIMPKTANMRRNSGSVNLSFSYVAAKLSRGDQQLRNTIKQQAPQLVEIERQRLINNRLINSLHHEK